MLLHYIIHCFGSVFFCFRKIKCNLPNFFAWYVVIIRVFMCVQLMGECSCNSFPLRAEIIDFHLLFGCNDYSSHIYYCFQLHMLTMIETETECRSLVNRHHELVDLLSSLYTGHADITQRCRKLLAC